MNVLSPLLQKNVVANEGADSARVELGHGCTGPVRAFQPKERYPVEAAGVDYSLRLHKSAQATAVPRWCNCCGVLFVGGHELETRRETTS